MSTTSFLDAALSYAARGWAVFPLIPRSKKPITAHGFKDATTDEAQIRAWWSERTDCNVGVRTGSASGIWVLDVDPRHEGVASLFELQQRIGDWSTVECITGWSGSHYYFSWDNARRVGCQAGDVNGLPQGLDVKGEGGYVVAPPSIHPDTGRAYEWEVSSHPDDMDVQHAPLALLELVYEATNGGGRKPGERKAAPGDDEIFEDGTRDKALISMAGRLRGQGLGLEAILDALKGFNARQCNPPKPIHDLERIAGSAARYEAGRPIKEHRAEKRAQKEATATQAAVDSLDDTDTDLAAAHRLAAIHGADLRYCGEREAWYVWDGRRWALDTAHRVEYLAGETARAYTVSMLGADAKQLTAAKRMEGRQRITGAVMGARSLPSIVIRSEALDAMPDMLTVRNGTIDLRTGTLGPHVREHLITHLIDVDYDPQATAPRFVQFLEEIHPGKPDITEFLRRWLGYCMTGQVREQALVLAVGEGRNGKGTLFEAFGRIVGHELSGQAPPGLLMAHKGDRHPADLMMLRGRRYVYASEVEGGSTFSEERMKFLTGGDTITARGMRENFTTFKPTHKLVLYVNDLPNVKDVSHAFWRRMRVVPFDQRFDGDACDQYLDQRLDSEAAGILAWAIRGAADWYASGLPVPVEVTAAAQAYRSEQDDVGRWMADQLLDIMADREQLCSEHFRSYSKWAEANGGRELTVKAFSDQLSRHKCTKRRTKRGVLWTVLDADQLGVQGVTGVGCRVVQGFPVNPIHAPVRGGYPTEVHHPTPYTEGEVDNPFGVGEAEF